MTKIKVCGITNVEDALYCIGLGIEYIGLIFCKESKRFIEYGNAKKIIGKARQENLGTKVVGVFSGAAINEIVAISKDLGLDLVQLHGKEDRGYIIELRGKLDEKIKIIKSIGVENEDSFKGIGKFDCDYILLDASKDGKFGGTGKCFDHSLITKAKIKKPLFIAGGLNISNIESALLHDVFAVDLNSGFEIFPGKKDHSKLYEAVKLIRRTR